MLNTRAHWLYNGGMKIDGRRIADDILRGVKKELAALKRPLSLFVLAVGYDPVSLKFVRQKEEAAEAVGIKFRFENMAEGSKEKDIIELIETCSEDGIVVQLPIHSVVDTNLVLKQIPLLKDVDVLSPLAWDAFESGASVVMPPVAGAVREICERYDVSTEKNKFVVVGQGRLVGKPVSAWLKSAGADVETVDVDTKNPEAITKKADVLISGTGKRGLIKPEMVKNWAVLIDAGSSEAAGKTFGDIDPACAEKASLFSPVPGGVGPITVALLLRNLVTLVRAR